MTPLLVLNGGSSSLKYAYYDEQAKVAGAAGATPVTGKKASIDGIGSSGPRDQAEAVERALQASTELGPPPRAVGHRLVHGGADSFAPSRVTEELFARLRDAVPFAPLHLPSQLATIESVRARFGDFDRFPQVVCFDTAFHRTLPEVAYRYALPEDVTRGGLRRYGFHGLSFEHLVAACPRAREGRVVLAHLGSGSSLAAVRDGASLDTTMGLTPTGGLVMGTRPGDLDPQIVVRLLRAGKSLDELETLLDHQSGLKALTGGTTDMREIVETKERDPRAALAFAVFCRTAQKHVAAMAVSLGGVDALVFTGGIGEKAAEVRDAIVRGLAFLGEFAVEVAPADEEERIFHHASELLAKEA